MLAQGRDMKDLKYKALWYPFGPILALVLCTIVILGQNYSAFANPAVSTGWLYWSPISAFALYRVLCLLQNKV